MLASLGANVVACDIEKDSVEETVAQITEQGLNATAVYLSLIHISIYGRSQWKN